MTNLCRFCFFKQMAVRARERAKSLDDQKLPCLGSNHHKAALDYEAMSEGEKRCRCGEPPPAPAVKPRVSRSVEEDRLDPL